MGALYVRASVMIDGLDVSLKDLSTRGVFPHSGSLNRLQYPHEGYRKHGMRLLNSIVVWFGLYLAVEENRP